MLNRVLSFDPGGTTGYAYQDSKEVHELGDTKDLFGFLAQWDLEKKPVAQVVVEGYRMRPGTEDIHMGKSLTTVEYVGVVKGWAYHHGIPCHEFLPLDKPTQCKATQIFPKKMPKAIEHRFDAYNHGRFWLIKFTGAPTALELEVMKNENSKRS